MEFSELIKIFVAGAALGNGPCLAYCLPIVLPYVLAGSGSGGWKKGLAVSAVFSLSRTAAYILLGGLAVLAYRFVWSALSGWMPGFARVFTGLLVVAAGVAATAGGESNFFCRLVSKIGFKRMELNAVALGFLTGLAPCLPLLGVLGYLGAIAPGFLWGAFGGFSFGLGTLFSPVLPLGALSGFLSAKTMKNAKFFVIMKVVSGIILIYFGLRLILPGVK